MNAQDMVLIALAADIGLFAWLTAYLRSASPTREEGETHMFGRKSTGSTGKTGRAAKPGEVGNKRGIPITKPTGTPVKGRDPRTVNTKRKGV
jgi:hypothetical protein